MSVNPRSHATHGVGDPERCQTERQLPEADDANGEESAANDTEARYGRDESPA